jgi:hypothetical protein
VRLERTRENWFRLKCGESLWRDGRLESVSQPEFRPLRDSIFPTLLTRHSRAGLFIPPLRGLSIVPFTFFFLLQLRHRLFPPVLPGADARLSITPLLVRSLAGQHYGSFWADCATCIRGEAEGIQVECIHACPVNACIVADVATICSDRHKTWAREKCN